jgi:hypothetical protein
VSTLLFCHLSSQRKNVFVCACHCHHFKGPKFICGVDVIAQKSHRSEGCLVYSIGSNNDISFEMGIKNFMGCETHTFDPTLNDPFVGDEYATFHPWGLGTDGEEMVLGTHNWTAKSMDTIVHELGHRDRTIDVMKIDCEVM